MDSSKVRENADVFPVFKFQRFDHASAMLHEGQVRLASIADFRQSKYGGRIDDPDEGRIHLFDSVTRTGTVREIEAEGAYIFCVTSKFLSGTLLWAISEKKETAVMIADPVELANRISGANPDLHFVGFHPCDYSGRRCADFGQSENELYRKAAWAKPSQYSDQMESRYVWRSRHTNSEEAILGRYNLSSLLIPVRYHNLKDFQLGEHRRIKTEISLIGGQLSGFEIEYPNEVATPVIFSSDRGRMLGFKIEGGGAQGGRFNGGSIGLHFRGRDLFACANLLSDIESIEYRF